jgi:hypothetical protein
VTAVVEGGSGGGRQRGGWHDVVVVALPCCQTAVEVGGGYVELGVIRGGRGCWGATVFITGYRRRSGVVRRRRGGRRRRVVKVV